MMDIAAASWWEILLRLILALVLGGLIGLERETVEKPAGLRTHTLVTLGAALFTLISKEGFFGSGADPARIASNIVVGIGFLGAGTIWRSGVNVQGLTTAATLWTSAAIGTAAGAGFYLGAHNVNIEHVEMSERMDKHVTITLAVRLPARLTRDEVIGALGDVGGVEQGRWKEGEEEHRCA